MIGLGALLLVIAVVLVVAAVVEGGDSVALEAFNRSVEAPVWTVFAAGVVTGLIVLAGVTLVMIGIRRGHARRKEVEYLRQRVAEQDQNSPLGDVNGTGGPDLDDVSRSGPRFGRRSRPADLS